MAYNKSESILYKLKYSLRTVFKRGRHFFAYNIRDTCKIVSFMLQYSLQEGDLCIYT